MADIQGAGRALGVLFSNLNDIDRVQMNAGGKVGFYGVTPIAQPASAVQAALVSTTATASGGFAFTNSTAFTAMLSLLENIRANLVLLGLLKGSA